MASQYVMYTTVQYMFSTIVESSLVLKNKTCGIDSNLLYTEFICTLLANQAFQWSHLYSDFGFTTHQGALILVPYSEAYNGKGNIE
jgi:hypothetical protein